MTAETYSKPSILEVAWQRYAQLNAYAKERSRPHYGLRRWIAILGVLATIFAVLTEALGDNLSATVEFGLKVVLVLTPIIASVLAAFVNKFHGGGDWLVARAGAEEVLKEIYMYRTVLKSQPGRREWLEKRLNAIQRQVYRGMGGELLLKPYTGPIPPYYNPSDPDSDDGFSDLAGADYFRLRLQNQLAWHIRKVNQFQMQRTRLQIFILAAGGAGAFLAALGGGFSLWVAVTASIGASLIGWQELRNYDPTIKNYSKVIMELMMVYDHWRLLEAEERTDGEFFRMVQEAEEVLWHQNVEYIRSMQEVLAGSKLEEAQLVDQVIRKAIETDAAMKRSMRENVVDLASESMDEAALTVSETHKAALGTLAEEASSDLVQAELRAMQEHVVYTAEVLRERFGGLSTSLEEIAREFSGVEIGKETPKEVLNDMISRFPASGEVKG